MNYQEFYEEVIRIKNLDKWETSDTFRLDIEDLIDKFEAFYFDY